MFFSYQRGILVENFLLVDEVERVGERRQKSAGREFEMKDDSRRVGRLDLVDHQVIARARAQLAIGRKNDLVVARGHVGGGQRRAVVKFDVLADLECVGLAVVGRLRHLGAEIADEMGYVRRVVRVDADQHAVERRDRMHRRVGALAVPVKARRRVRRDHVGEGAAVFRLLVAVAGIAKSAAAISCHTTVRPSRRALCVPRMREWSEIPHPEEAA